MLDKTGLRISLPRQPAALPKLHVQVPVVPDISARFALPYNTNSNTTNEHYNSSNDHYYSQSKGGQYSPYSASSSKAANRCVSWSPSQAIPEGHYSKGFTLTSFQKVIDKHYHPPTTPSSSSTAPPSLTLSHPAAAAAASLKRSNTSHPQRRVSTTLTPFQRLVGRSKSLKIKAPAALINNIIMETESSVLPSEGFASFHTTLVTSPTTTNTPHTINTSNTNNNNINSNRPKSVSPRLSKIILNYETRPAAGGGDKNSPGDASKHSNTIQSQGSRNASLFASNNSKSSNINNMHITTGVSILESEKGAPTIIPITPTSTKTNTTTTPASTATTSNTTPISSSKKVTSKPNSVNNSSNSVSHEQDQSVAKAALVSELQPVKAKLSVSVNAHKPAIATICVGPCKPLWQHTRTNADEIRALGLTNQEIQKQETIFELIYTESEYLDDLKHMHKVTTYGIVLFHSPYTSTFHFS